MLAPTDAALSAGVVSDQSLPVSIRRSLNVESGLNDGIATPAVTGFIAASAALLGVGAIEETASSPGVAALADLLGGLAIGVIVGYLGGHGLTRARAAGWVAPGGRRIGVLMLAALAFLVAHAVEVNYFVAAFVAGVAFRAGTGKEDEEATELPDPHAELGPPRCARPPAARWGLRRAAGQLLGGLAIGLASVS